MTDETRSWGEAVAGCRVSIARLTGPPGPAVTLDIVFRNDGAATVLFPRSSLWFDYDFAVSSESAEVPLTEFGRQQRDNLGTAAAAVAEVAPRGQYQATVELSKLYELRRPGAYTVQASKVFRDPASHEFVTVRSNRLSFTVNESR